MVTWLILARGIQGLATGLALSAASTALLDLHPRHDPDSVGLHNAVASATGMGVGVLASAAIVELLPAPLVVPYLMTFALFAVAFGLTLAWEHPVARSGRQGTARRERNKAPEIRLRSGSDELQPTGGPHPVRADSEVCRCIARTHDCLWPVSVRVACSRRSTS